MRRHDRLRDDAAAADKRLDLRKPALIGGGRLGPRALEKLKAACRGDFFSNSLEAVAAAGAVLPAAWRVEATESVIGNMAPVLLLPFTPLFTVMLLVFLAV